jgi:hypothetical protein
MYFLSNICTSVGLLKVGVPKTWEESKKDLRYIRNAGVRQFISTYNRVKDLKGDELLFGDEVEYGVFILDHEKKKIRLSLRAKEVQENDDIRSFILPSFSCCQCSSFFTTCVTYCYHRLWTN